MGPTLGLLAAVVWARCASAEVLVAESADGLGLKFSPEGEVMAAKIGAVRLPSAQTRGGFEAMDMQKATPVEMLAEPSFEGGADFWILASSALTGAFANLQSGDMAPFRELYKRYVPVVRRLSAAGWEPLTGAKVIGQPRVITEKAEDYGGYPGAVLIERFGTAEAGNLHFALYNCGAAREACEVELDLEALGIGAGEAVRARELMTGMELEVEVVGKRARMRCPVSEEGLGVASVR